VSSHVSIIKLELSTRKRRINFDRFCSFSFLTLNLPDCWYIVKTVVSYLLAFIIGYSECQIVRLA